MFLSQDDIEMLTGYKKYKCQIKWLCQNGIKYLVGCDGKPRVLVSQIESVIGASVNPTKRRVEPNFDNLNKRLRLV